MVYEFAIDPAALSTWDNFRFVISQCGVEHGRLISRYPKEWKKLVYDACTEQPVKRKSIASRLFKVGSSTDYKGIDHLLIRLGRPYNGGETWLTNAQKQHANRPFKAIITKDSDIHSKSTIHIDDLDDSHPEWQTKLESLRRTPENLAESARLLLMTSKRIIFIDPYFDPSKNNYRESFKKFFEIAFLHHTPESIEIHASNQCHPQAVWQNALFNEFSKLLPAGSSIDVYRWENFDDKMHPRFIITELGGLHYDYGLGADIQSTTVINRRSSADCREICKNFKKETSPYTLIDIIKVEGGNVR